MGIETMHTDRSRSSSTSLLTKSHSVANMMINVDPRLILTFWIVFSIVRAGFEPTITAKPIITLSVRNKKPSIQNKTSDLILVDCNIRGHRNRGRPKMELKFPIQGKTVLFRIFLFCRSLTLSYKKQKSSIGPLNDAINSFFYAKNIFSSQPKTIQIFMLP